MNNSVPTEGAVSNSTNPNLVDNQTPEEKMMVEALIRKLQKIADILNNVILMEHK